MEEVGQASNEEAAQAMISLLGGATGMAEKGIRLGSLVPILNADPSNDLSGLRLIAGRMVDSPETVVRERQEPRVYPDEARDWLLRTDRVENIDGRLTLKENGKDHLGEAALSLALSEDGGLLTLEYAKVTNSRHPLHPDMVRDIAISMVNDFDGPIKS